MRRELRAGRFDVVHVHEPPAPLVSWDASTFRDAPVVGTFHAYSTKPFPNYAATLLGARRIFNQLSARIAVSRPRPGPAAAGSAATTRSSPTAWTSTAAPAGPKPAADHLRLLFVGRAEERKGLPVLLTAFEALVEHVPSQLTVIGADPEEVSARVTDPEAASRIDVLGKVSDDSLWRQLGEADVLCAPSLAGESFGMVLIEAIAAGTPVIASEIAGYNDVVTDGVDGLLRARPRTRSAWPRSCSGSGTSPSAARRWARPAAVSAERYAWPRIADEVTEVYERPMEPAPEPPGACERAARRTGLTRLDGGPRRPAKRLPPLEPAPVGGAAAPRAARKIGVGLAGDPRPRPDRAGRADGRRGQGRGEPDPLRHHLGADRLRSDGRGDVRPRRLLGRDRPGRAPRPAGAPPRRHLGDDDRGADVGDAAGPPRRARQGDGPGPPGGADARDLRGADRHPGLPVRAQHRSPWSMLGGIIVSTTDLFQSSTQKLFLVVDGAAAPARCAARWPPAWCAWSGSGRMAGGRRRSGALSAGPHRAQRLPRPAPRLLRDLRPARGLGPPAARLLGAVRRPRARSPGRHRCRRCVLFAVNVTAVVPATPSNIGIFQLAVISVLTAGFGVSGADALAYGVVLQAVEIATAVALGLPALVREGVTLVGHAPARALRRTRPPLGAPARPRAG